MQNNYFTNGQTEEYYFKKPLLHNNLNIVNCKNFINGLQNAKKILEGLEKSIEKTKKYERSLFNCKSTHAHRHGEDVVSENNSCKEIQEYNNKGRSNFSDYSENCSRGQVDLAESWSTMSIVCLQYQYEELSKRYASLLQAYDDRGNMLNSRVETLAEVKKQARVAYAKLAHAHNTLITIGEKYLALVDKMRARNRKHTESVNLIKKRLQSVLLVAERTRLELDAELKRKLAMEKNVNTAVLLGEIRKCNRVCLENLRLKAKIEELAPGQINWDSFFN